MKKITKRFYSKLKNKAKRLEKKLERTTYNQTKIEQSNSIWLKWHTNYHRHLDTVDSYFDNKY